MAIRKYRVWNPEMGKMLDWDTVKGMMAELLLTESEINKPMQFTGLLDKAGKEIYEGDIVEETGNGNKDKYEIIFEKGEFRFRGKSSFSIRGVFLDLTEVIGNIYENPKLLD